MSGQDISDQELLSELRQLTSHLGNELENLTHALERIHDWRCVDMIRRGLPCQCGAEDRLK